MKKLIYILPLIFTCAYSIHAQTPGGKKLLDLIPSLYWGDGISLATAPTASHTAHFSIASLASINRLNEQIAAEIGGFPFSSSVGGFSFDFDPVLGDFVTTTKSLGPLIAENAATLGRNKLSTNLSYTYLMAKESLPDIPIIFCMVSNPHRYGLSGANLVGISMEVPGETQFALYKSVMPDLKTIGVIYDPTKSETLVLEADQAAQKLGLKLLMAPVSSHKKVPKALRDMLGKIDALWMVPDDTVLTTASFRFFLVTSFEKKLPFLAISDIFVKVGALATIAPAPLELGHQIRQLANQLQSGELDLALVDILAPAQTNLVINVKTAKKIGLDLSPEILESASKLYQ